MIWIAVDAMGGDYAPRHAVDGALAAVRHFDLGVALAGPAATIEAELARHVDVDRARVRILDAPDVVAMDETPARALRRKPGASIKVAAEAVAKGEAAALFSAGHTGATVMAAYAAFGMLPGVDRPALAATIPTRGRPAVLLDVGASVECRPQHLLQFAVMGSLFAQHVLGVKRPRVGLLNIGEEEEKGNAVVKEAYQLLRRSAGIHFLGNVEGRDIPAGEARGQPLDVVVCDGFVGNVVLKFYESAARVFVALMNRESPDILQRPEMAGVLKVLDYATYGGAPLLGVQGVSIICHGSSPARAIKNAIRVALKAVESHVTQDIGAEFAQGGAVA